MTQSGDLIQSPWRHAVSTILFKDSSSELVSRFFSEYTLPRDLAEADASDIVQRLPELKVEEVERAIYFSVAWVEGTSVNELFKIDIPEKEE